MSELRKAMTDQMLLKGFSERTKKSYLDAVSLLARYYHLPPDKLSRSDIQNWFSYLIKDR
ncbi:MAG: integrase, partial [Gammaproteobacteria bacterium]|nr:integrase [Gammaproteobacteria bacterium]